MKSFCRIFKWMAGVARPFIVLIILITVLGSILSLCDVSIAVVSKTMIDSAVSGEKSAMVSNAVSFILLIFSLIVIEAIVSIMSVNVFEKLSNSIHQRLSKELLNIEWIELSKYHSEDILTRMTSDAQVVAKGIVYAVPDMVALLVRIAAAFMTLLFFEPTLALLAFALGPLSVLMSRFFGRRLKKIHVKAQEAEGSYRSFLHEFMQNIIVVKTFNMGKESIERIGELQAVKLKWVMKRSKMNTAVDSTLSLGYWVSYFLAFFWGVLRLSQGRASFGTLTAFFQLVGQIHSPFVGLAYKFPQLITAAASAERLLEFEELRHEDESFSVSAWTSAGVNLHKVSFAYEEDKPVLKKASLQIYPGEIVGFVGTSGEGKTTIVRLLLSLISPQKGHIYFTSFTGEKLKSGASSRRLISYVPQENHLFSGSIRENLYVGDACASDKELEAALKAACAFEFIEKLPDGMDTIIGERGLGFSDGQVQRLSIARALLRKTPILILDEATSSLDLSTEKKVLNNIQNLNYMRTCIIVTHRPAALEICNRVLRLENGKIIEEHSSVTLNQVGEVI